MNLYKLLWCKFSQVRAFPVQYQKLTNDFMCSENCFPFWLDYHRLHNSSSTVVSFKINHLVIYTETDQLICKVTRLFGFYTMAQKWSFSLKVSSVTVTKSTVSYGSGNIYWRILNGKLHFLCSELWGYWPLTF